MTVKSAISSTIAAGLAALALMFCVVVWMERIGVNFNEFPENYPVLLTLVVFGVLGERLIGPDGKFGAIPHFVIMMACALALTTVPHPTLHGFGLWVNRLGDSFLAYNVGALGSWIFFEIAQNRARRQIAERRP